MSVRRTGKRAHRAMRRDLPLVSCIMPTYNRRRFVPEAIRLFLTQDYPRKELVVLDDGEDNIADLIPSPPQVRYVRLDRRQSIAARSVDWTMSRRLGLVCVMAAEPADT